MEILGADRIVRFVQTYAPARQAFIRWTRTVQAANWANFAEVKETFPRADYVPKNQYVFNVGGNKYRVIALIDFANRQLILTYVMTHEQYDRKNWSS